MITAVDTNILVDVFAADAFYGPLSRTALETALGQGSLIACDVVWAEVAASFADTGDFGLAMERLGVGFSPLDQESAAKGGTAWRAYRRRGGQRDRVIADFLIGGHALTRADRLLTRERGFYRTYFRELSILDAGKRT